MHAATAWEEVRDWRSGGAKLCRTRPQHREVLSWNLAPSFSDNAFTFDPPADAHRIAIETVKAKATNKSQ